MRIRAALGCGILAAALLGLPVSLCAESLQSAMSYAYENSPEINATRASVRASAETITQTRSGLLPQVNLNASFGRSGQEIAGNWIASDAASASLSASLLLYDGGQTQNAIKAAQSDTQAALLRLQASEQQLLLGVVQAYIDVLRAQSLVSLNRRNVENAQTQSRSAQIRFDEGISDASEVAQVDASVSAARADLVSSEADLASAVAAYVQRVGRQPSNLQDIAFPTNLPTSLDQAIASARVNSPLIKSATETERAAQYRLRQAKGAKLPSVNLNASGGLSDNFDDGLDSTTSGNVGINLSVPLYSGGRLSSLARQAEDLMVARSNETNNTRTIVEQTAANAWSSLQSAAAALDALNAAAEAQETALRTTQIQFDEGIIDLTVLLDRQHALLSAQVSAQNMQYQQQFAAYNLLYAVGTLGVDTLGLSVRAIDPLDSTAQSSEPKSPGQQTIDALSGRWKQ